MSFQVSGEPTLMVISTPLESAANGSARIRGTLAVAQVMTVRPPPVAVRRGKFRLRSSIRGLSDAGTSTISRERLTW